jgi:hypothetical protein
MVTPLFVGGLQCAEWKCCFHGSQYLPSCHAAVLQVTQPVALWIIRMLPACLIMTAAHDTSLISYHSLRGNFKEVKP